jgi:hypothetical protein
MKTYEVLCKRRNGASTPVRRVVFLIDADSEEQAEDIADARLARMRDYSEPEQDIDACHEVTIL